MPTSPRRPSVPVERNATVSLPEPVPRTAFTRLFTRPFTGPGPGRRRGWPIGRSSRRWPLRHPHRRVLVAVLVILAVLATADRVLVRVTERRLAEQLACLTGLTGAVTVSIGGVPFLTQAAGGHLRSVTLTASGLRRSEMVLSDVSIVLHDVRLPPLSGLTSRPAPGSVHVRSIIVAATVPYTAVNDRKTGGDTRDLRVSYADDGRLKVETQLVMPIGTAQVTVVGRPVIRNGRLSIQPDSIKAFGRQLPTSLFTGLTDRSGSAEVTLPDPLYGATYDAVEATADGLRMYLSAPGSALPDAAQMQGRCTGPAGGQGGGGPGVSPPEARAITL